jgi:hypothetical protein
MITGEYRPGEVRVPRSGVGVPGSVPFNWIEPADQVPYRSTSRARPHHRIEGCQMKAPSSSDSGDRLGPYLYEIVIAGQSAGSSGNGVLRRFGYGRAASLRLRSRHTRLTRGDQDGTECGRKAVGSAPARHGSRQAGR